MDYDEYMANLNMYILVAEILTEIILAIIDKKRPLKLRHKFFSWCTVAFFIYLFGMIHVL